VRDGKLLKKTAAALLVGQKAPSDIVNPDTDEVIVKKHKKITKAVIKKMEAANIQEIPLENEEVIGKIVADDVVDPKTSEVLARSIKSSPPEDLDKVLNSNIGEFDILFIDNLNVSPSLRNTLFIDKVNTKKMP
jgi:DNA-directed RNA polymerase subunit beta